MVETRKRGGSGSADGAIAAGDAGDFAALEKTCADLLERPGRRLSGLAAAILKDGRIAWEGYFGARRFSDSGDQPVDEKTRWRVASISKPATSLGAMRLVERGLLDLDRDVSEYLGYELRNPSFPGEPITVRMLLGHTSSLRDAGFYFPPLGHSLRDLFLPGGRYYDGGSHFAPRDPAADTSPGSFYCYCNLGYGLLGSVIERLSGRRFDLFMKEELFDPLGIDGGFNPNLLSDEAFSNLSPLYRKCGDDEKVWNTEGPWIPQIDEYGGVRPALPVRLPQDAGEKPSLDDYVLGENGALFSPQGGMRVCARDLARLSQVFMDGGARILSEESVRAMMMPGWTRREGGGNALEEHSPVYATGLGLMRPTAPGGGPAMWGHRGNAYGFLGGMFVDRTKNAGYLYMIGGTGADPDRARAPASGLSVWEEELGLALESALGV